SPTRKRGNGRPSLARRAGRLVSAARLTSVSWAGLEMTRCNFRRLTESHEELELSLVVTNERPHQVLPRGCEEVDAVEQLDWPALKVPRARQVEAESLFHVPNSPQGDVHLLSPGRRPRVGLGNLTVDRV